MMFGFHVRSPFGLKAMAMAVLLGLATSGWAAPTTYHVHTEGSDQNPGTEARPFATIQQAVDRAQPGDVIQVGPGVFREPVVIRRSGTPEAPIILQGTRGDQGDHSSCISPSVLVAPSTWEPASQVGPGVFQNRHFDQDPELLTIDGLFLAHVHRRYADEIPQVLNYPDGHQVDSRGIMVRFWDVLHGVFAHHPEQKDHITFLRLAGGRDPRDHVIRASMGGAAVLIENASHVIVRDFAISESHVGIRVSGKEARHNLIERCHITHGRQRIHLTEGASHITVRDSDLRMGFHGMTPGAWAGAKTVEQAGRAYQYWFFKYRHHSQQTSNDRAIEIDGQAHQLLIEDNRLWGGLIGIGVGQARDVMIRGNTIQHFSSVGMALRAGAEEVHVVENQIEDSSINLRFHMLGNPHGHRVYVYRNRLAQPDGVGQHIFCHTDWTIAGPYPQPQIAVYHNTFVGGVRGFLFPRPHPPPQHPEWNLEVVPGFVVLNNVFQGPRPIVARTAFREDPEALGAYDYNWLSSEAAPDALPAWFGEHNLVAAEGGPALSGFQLPQEHPAREAGLDLSRAFTVNGKTFAPLPGMEPGYFSGERPDLGAIQHERGS